MRRLDCVRYIYMTYHLAVFCEFNRITKLMNALLLTLKSKLLGSAINLPINLSRQPRDFSFSANSSSTSLRETRFCEVSSMQFSQPSGLLSKTPNPNAIFAPSCTRYSDRLQGLPSVLRWCIRLSHYFEKIEMALGLPVTVL